VFVWSRKWPILVCYGAAEDDADPAVVSLRRIDQQEMGFVDDASGARERGDGKRAVPLITNELADGERRLIAPCGDGSGHQEDSKQRSGGCILVAFDPAHADMRLLPDRLGFGHQREPGERRQLLVDFRRRLK
jgi:hypothetical protein